jgi:hypothetical protein
VGYLQRPLSVQSAAPDPFGNETLVLDDWVPAHIGAARELGAVQFGVLLPLSLGTSGTGLAGVTSRDQTSSVLGIGAPHLQVRHVHWFGDWALGVLQEVVLPFGHEQSFLGSRAWAYAPKATLQWTHQPFWFLASFGARFRTPVAFGPVRFGSEALIALGAGLDLTRHYAIALDSWLLPALQEDEQAYLSSVTRTQRTPAEWLFSLAGHWQSLRVSVGAGTSLPLSREHSRSGSTTFAGPPGPRMRLQTRLETSW